MTARWPIAVVSGALFLAVSACGGGSDSSTDPSGSGGSGSSALCSAFGATGIVASGTLTANIDGASFKAVCIVFNTTVGNAFGLGGVDGFTGNFKNFAFGTDKSVGTHTVGLGSVTNAGLIIGTSGWHANSATGSGSVTITTLTAHNAVGTFTFSLPAQGPPATGTKSITNGSFNVTF
ncbi:MAG TPA: hypothetical protein VJP86_01115 [Vicinamibacterales bacterium]|jgi:hypothetical protein|nr:hypothetical protein [Vicinamibacterales bacterium]